MTGGSSGFHSYSSFLQSGQPIQCVTIRLRKAGKWRPILAQNRGGLCQTGTLNTWNLTLFYQNRCFPVRLSARSQELFSLLRRKHVSLVAQISIPFYPEPKIIS
jgi:subtilisin-like proprotein convertase family protein